MAQVPTYGNFQASPGVVGYRPMSTSIPKAPEAKVDLSGLSDEFMKFQEEQDEARVTVDLTELRRHAVEVETGPSGFRNLQGGRALEADEQGRGLVERVDTDMHDFGAKLMEKLTPRQRKLFAEKAQSIYTASYGAVSSHVYDQGMKFQRGAYEGEADHAVEAGSTYYDQPDMLASSQRLIADSAARLKDLNGWTEEQKLAYQREKTSGLYMNAVNQVLSQANDNPSVAYQALGILEKHSASMRGSDVAQARRVIDGYIKEAQQEATVASVDRYGSMLYAYTANTFMIAASEGKVSVKDLSSQAANLYESVVVEGDNMQTNTRKAGDEANWRYGISKMKITDAYEVYKSRGGNLSEKDFAKAFQENRGFAFKIGLDHMDDLTAKYAGDQEKVFAAYYGGADQLETAMKQAESAGTPAAWFYNLPRETQEYVTRCMRITEERASTIPKDSSGKEANTFEPGVMASAYRMMTYDQAREAVLRSDPRARTDPSYCEQTVARVMARQNQHKSSYLQEQENRMADVMEKLYTSGGDLSAIPQSMWASLGYATQKDVLKFAKKFQIGDDSTVPEIAGRYADDGTLASISEAQLRGLRGFFSADDYEKLQFRYYKLKNEAGMAADQRANEVRAVATSGYAPEYGNVSSADVRRAAETFFPKFTDLDKESQNIIVWQMSKRLAAGDSLRGAQTKGSLNVIEALKGVARQMVVIDGTFGSSQKTLYTLAPTDLPDDGPADARTLLKSVADKQYGREATEGEQREVLLDLMLGVAPNIDLTNVTLDETLANKIRADFRAKKGRNITNLELVRAYLIERLQGTEAENPNDRFPSDRASRILISTDDPYGAYAE